MTLSVTHAKVSGITDGADTSLVRPSDWNATHVVSGGVTESFIIACTDETTAVTTGLAKVTFRMPYAFTITGVKGSLTTAQATGSLLAIDVNEGVSSILSTKLTINNGAKTSVGATTPVVISDAAIAADAEMTIDVDTVGDGTARGLKVTIIGTQ